MLFFKIFLTYILKMKILNKMELEKLKFKLMSQQISNINLNKKQNEAYEMMIKGYNVFITGMAGTGKTSVVKMFYQIAKYNKKIGITSTTGISALLFGGSTLHSFTGIGLGNGSVFSLTQKIQKNGFMRNRWRKLDILIIDEVSMLSPVLFDKLEEIARIIRKNSKPFGGIQLILSGDFCQLPCVQSEKFCFQSEIWDNCVHKTIYLNEIIRQKDTAFQKVLNNIRIGNITQDVIDLLESRVDKNLDNSYGIKPTQLFSTNASVDYINEQELDKLTEISDVEFFEYEMELEIPKKTKTYLVEKYLKSCSAVDQLQLCVGAQVMLLHNLDIDNGLVNGSRGIIVDFVEDLPIVKFLNGTQTFIDYHTWEIEDNDKLIMSITQIPLKLAWCLTIHKCQGVSLDYAEVNLENIFEYGQAYVGLSRIKNIEGLSISGLKIDKIKAHPEAVAYYKKLSIV